MRCVGGEVFLSPDIVGSVASCYTTSITASCLGKLSASPSWIAMCELAEARPAYGGCGPAHD